MAADVAGAKELIKAGLIANMTVMDAAAARETMAAAQVAAMMLLLSTIQIAVPSGLANAGGPVTGTIPAGGIT